MSDIIGECGNCGGNIVMPSMMVNAKPYCEDCGAKPKQKWRPVLEMEPAPRKLGKTVLVGEKLLAGETILAGETFLVGEEPDNLFVIPSKEEGTYLIEIPKEEGNFFVEGLENEDYYLNFSEQCKKEVEEVLKIGQELNEISAKKAKERKV